MEINLNVQEPIVLKTIYDGPIGIIGFGAFWDIVPLDFLMTEQTEITYTNAHISLQMENNTFTIKSSPVFTLIPNDVIILKMEK